MQKKKKAEAIGVWTDELFGELKDATVVFYDTVKQVVYINSLLDHVIFYYVMFILV